LVLRIKILIVATIEYSINKYTIFPSIVFSFKVSTNISTNN
jgi:hypothetical protein